MSRPRIVCLCGSTKFGDAWREAYYAESMAGHIVLSCAQTFALDGNDAPKLSAEEKLSLDTLHHHKIDLADEVLILNVGHYIGQSTRHELVYARGQRKRIRWLVPIDDDASSFRASQDTLCVVCDRPYGKHPLSEHTSSNGDGYLNRLCDGALVKL